MAIRPFKDKSPVIDSSAYVDETAVIIGDVTIGKQCSIWPMVVARGDVNSIIIGDYSNVQDGSVLHVAHDSEFEPGGMQLNIGKYVTAGHNVTLHGCTIGDYCLVGMSSTVMDGVIIEDKVIIGAGSLVTPGKVLESGYLYVGNPIKRARKLKDKELEFLGYAAGLYAELKEDHTGNANN